MIRSLTALLGRQLAPAGDARGRGGGGSRGRARTHTRARRGATAAVWSRKRLRIAALVALSASVVAVGGWLLLRSTSLSTIEKVRITGLHGREAAQIEAALREATHGMSTLHVRVAALRAAVARFPLVREVRAQASFPHGLHIRVIERPPVAELIAGGQRTAVAADGVVLGTELLTHTLPSVKLDGIVPLPGHAVVDATTRAELKVLGAAPTTLLGWIESIASGSEGIVATMRGGIEVYFGNASRAHAKWAAAARVIADPSSVGASYVDVRLPERPVSGTATTLGGGAPATTSAGGEGTLAAKLDEAVAGGSAGAAVPATSETSSTTGPSTSSESGTSGSTPSETTSGETTSGAVSAPASSESATEAPSSESAAAGESGGATASPAAGEASTESAANQATPAGGASAPSG